MCLIPFFSRASSPDPHPFHESEIIFPEVFPDSSPPSREKANSRDTDAGVGSSSREVRSISNRDGYVHPELHHWDSSGPLTTASSGLRLRIPAFGKDLHLILKRDSRFLSQKFTVEGRQKARKASPRSAPASSAASAERECYYSGSVLNYTGSIASFSTCAGLVNSLHLLLKMHAL